MFSREICEIFKNTYFQQHLRTTASILHRSSFLEVFYRSCCSGNIAFPQQDSKFESVTCKFTKNRTPSQVFFSKNFTAGAEQRYWKMHLDGYFWGRICFGNIPAWLLLKGSCKHIFILEILTDTNSYMTSCSRGTNFYDFFWSKDFGVKYKHTELALNFVQKQCLS